MRYNADGQMKKEQDALSAVVRMRQGCRESAKGSSASFIFVLLLACLPAIAYQQGLIPDFVKKNAVGTATERTALVNHGASNHKATVHNHHTRHGR